MNKQIPHNRVTLDREEEMAAARVIQSGWLTQGKEVQRFEDEFCKFLQLPKGHAVAVSSGTSALFLALWVLNAKGKRIAIPSYVCSALRNSIAMANGKEVLVDNGVDSPNINIELLNHSFADIAIIPHLYGIPQNLSDVSHKIKIIEDCAQALGARINGVPAGLQGDIGIFSFYATKLMTSGGQGGMIVSKDRALIDKIKDYRLFDQRMDKDIRFNFQMTDLQAAIGRVQLNKLPQFIKRREEIFFRYQTAGLPLLEGPQGVTPVRFRAILFTNNQQKIMKALEKEQIKSVNPIKSWELLGSSELFPQSFQWTQKTVSLPIYPSLTDEEVERIISIILKEQKNLKEFP